MAAVLDDILQRLNALPENERNATIKEAHQATAKMRWVPSPGPQTEAYFCEADDLFYGGEAGGGKSDLLIGLALNEHTKSLILRREREQAKDLFDRIEDIQDNTDGRNGADLIWDIGDHNIQFGGCKDEKDKQKRKGRAKDLYGFDEITDFTKSQFEFIKTWNRSAKPGQRCRVVATGNPPTTTEGQWVIDYWGAWLDPKHANPAREGELRWYTTDKNGKQIEVDGRGPHLIEYEDGTSESLLARSRTFIRAGVKDNPYLGEDYAATLDSLPPELRAAYRDGRFDLSLEDNPWQAIPTHWILAAIERGKKNPRPPANVAMTSIGIDTAQGGKDNTVLAPRYGGWYAPLVVIEGKKTPDGKSVAAQVVMVRRDGAVPIIDMGGGYGGSTKETLEDNNISCVGYKGSLDSSATSVVGKMAFKNKRTEAYWRFREALDPDQPGGSFICLPDDSKLLADLAAPIYTIERGKNNRLTVILETKKDLVARIQRSPDRGDAVVMALTDGSVGDPYPAIAGRRGRGSAPPKVVRGHENRKRRNK